MSHVAETQQASTGVRTGDLRLYAISVDDVRTFFGADPARAAQLREQANAILAPPPAARPKKLGPIFKRTPAAPVLAPTDPVPADLDALLHGAYVPPERTGATWRLLETLIAANAWGSTRTEIASTALDELDFALTRGGVSSGYGLRHLLTTSTQVNLLPVHGLTVGFHTHRVAVAMADGYRRALPEVESPAHRDLVEAFAGWLDQFGPWGERARELNVRPPDLLGFWVY